MPDRRAQLLRVLQQRKSTPARPQREDWPLSSAQLRVWLHQQQRPDSPAYSEPTAVRIRGPVLVKSLRSGLEALSARHDALRMTFFLRNGEPRQKVAAASPPLEVSETSLPENDLEAAIHSFCSMPFELESGPLLRACLYRLGEQHHVLLLVMHHLVVDGWSAHQLARELVDQLTGAPAAIPPLTTYGQYCLQQHSEVQVGPLAHWKERLTGLPSLPLPGPQQQRDLRCRQLSLHLDQALQEQLTRLARQHQCTVFSLFLLAWGVVLGQWSGSHDVAVGVPMSQRPRQELERVVGLFLNTLPIRLDLSGDPTLEILCRRHWASYSLDLAHQNCSLERVLPELNRYGQELFSNLLNLQPVAPPAYRQGALEISAWPSHNGFCKFPLALNLQSLPEGGWQGRLDYAAERFSADSMGRLVQRFVRVLHKLWAEPELRLSQLGLPDQELETLAQWESGPTCCKAERSLLELFREQVEARPNAPCLLQGTERLSYRQLDEESNQLAWGLAARGIRPGQRVLLCWPRQLDRWVGLLAVLKCGATFVPMEADDPPEWVQRIAQDCEASLVLRHSDWQAMTGARAYPLRSEPGTPLALLYTSGSSGHPKAVSVSWPATLNRFEWMWREFPFAADDVLCHRSAFGFVDALWELFGGLLAGQPTAVVSPQDSLALALQRERVTRLVTVPALLEDLLAADLELLKGLRLVVSSGEALPPALARAFRRRLAGARLLNLYGSTEVSGDITWQEVEDPECVALGRPLPGCRVVLLDPAGQRVPIGSTGEIYLAGANLALGYWRGSQERFAVHETTGQRMFRSGDLGRWDECGRLHYLGRADRQLKIRGIRIQPEFLEAFLAGLEGVREAHVMVQDKQLLAYVAGQGEPESWGRQLRRRLPRAYWPDRLIHQAGLPRNNRGKVDARGLLPAAPQLQAKPPESSLQVRLLPIWRRHLNQPEMGATDDFFEWGGNSLKALSLLLDCEKEVGRKIPLSWLFDDSTVARLTSRLQSEPEDHSSNLVSLRSGTGDPLILLHAMGGGLDYYQDLIDSLPGKEIWGFYGLDPGPGEWTLSDLADRYVGELVRKHPAGTCVLLGLSLGGSIAYQMACSLQALGRDVRLIIVDSYAPGYYRAPQSPWWVRQHNLVQRFQLQLGHLLRRVHPAHWPKFLHSKLTRRELTPLPTPLIEKMRRALANYRPPVGQPPLQASTLLLRANYQPWHLQDRLLGWGTYLGGPVRVEAIPGMHGTCLVERPILKQVLPHIQAMLET